MSDRHFIGEAVFDVSFGSRELARRRQGKLAALVQERLLPLVDEVLDEFAGVLPRIDRLEVDLGEFGEDCFEADMPGRFKEKLRAALLSASATSSSALHAAEAEATPAQRRLRLFLETGRVERNADSRTAEAIGETLLSEVRADPAGFADYLKQSPRRETIVKRMAKQFSGTVLAEALRLLSSASSEGVPVAVDAGADTSDWERLIQGILEGDDGLGLAMAKFESALAQGKAGEATTQWGRLAARRADAVREAVARQLADGETRKKFAAGFPETMLLDMAKLVAPGAGRFVEALTSQTKALSPATEMDGVTKRLLWEFTLAHLDELKARAFDARIYAQGLGRRIRRNGIERTALAEALRRLAADVGDAIGKDDDVGQEVEPSREPGRREAGADTRRVARRLSGETREDVTQVVAELANAHPSALRALYREIQSGALVVAADTLTAREARQLVLSVIGLDGESKTAEFRREIERCAPDARDEAGYYRYIFACLAQGRVVDLRKATGEAPKDSRNALPSAGRKSVGQAREESGGDPASYPSGQADTCTELGVARTSVVQALAQSGTPPGVLPAEDVLTPNRAADLDHATQAGPDSDGGEQDVGEARHDRISPADAVLLDDAFMRGVASEIAERWGDLRRHHAEDLLEAFMRWMGDADAVRKVASGFPETMLLDLAKLAAPAAGSFLEAMADRADSLSHGVEAHAAARRLFWEYALAHLHELDRRAFDRRAFTEGLACFLSGSGMPEAEVQATLAGADANLADPSRSALSRFESALVEGKVEEIAEQWGELLALHADAIREAVMRRLGDGDIRRKVATVFPDAMLLDLARLMTPAAARSIEALAKLELDGGADKGTVRRLFWEYTLAYLRGPGRQVFDHGLYAQGLARFLSEYGAADARIEMVFARLEVEHRAGAVDAPTADATASSGAPFADRSQMALSRFESALVEGKAEEIAEQWDELVALHADAVREAVMRRLGDGAIRSKVAKDFPDAMLLGLARLMAPDATRSVEALAKLEFDGAADKGTVQHLFWEYTLAHLRGLGRRVFDHGSYARGLARFLGELDMADGTIRAAFERAQDKVTEAADRWTESVVQLDAEAVALMPGDGDVRRKMATGFSTATLLDLVQSTMPSAKRMVEALAGRAEAQFFKPLLWQYTLEHLHGLAGREFDEHAYAQGLARFLRERGVADAEAQSIFEYAGADREIEARPAVPPATEAGVWPGKDAEERRPAPPPQSDFVLTQGAAGAAARQRGNPVERYPDDASKAVARMLGDDEARRDAAANLPEAMLLDAVKLTAPSAERFFEALAKEMGFDAGGTACESPVRRLFWECTLAHLHARSGQAFDRRAFAEDAMRFLRDRGAAPAEILAAFKRAGVEWEVDGRPEEAAASATEASLGFGGDVVGNRRLALAKLEFALERGKVDDIAGQWDDLVAHEAEAMREVMARRLADGRTRAKAAAAFPDRMLRDVVKVMAPQASRLVEALMSEVRSAAAGKDGAAGRLAWEYTLAYLHDAGGRAFDEHAYTQGLDRHLAGNAVMPEALRKALRRIGINSIDTARSDGTGQSSDQPHGPDRQITAEEAAFRRIVDRVGGKVRQDVTKEIAVLAKASPAMLKELYRRFRTGEITLDAAALYAAEARQLALSFVGSEGEAKTAEFRREIERHTPGARDEGRYYCNILESLVKGRIVDLQKAIDAASPAAEETQGRDAPQPFLRERADVLSLRLAGRLRGDGRETEMADAIDELVAISPSAMKRLYGQLKSGGLRADVRSLSAKEAARLVEAFIKPDRGGEPTDLQQAVAAYADRARDAGIYYRRVLQMLIKDRLVDLEAAAEARSIPVEDAAAPTPAPRRMPEAPVAASRPADGPSAFAEMVSPPSEGDEPTTELYVPNAGIVLAAPYLPRLFGLLELTAEGKFRDERAIERAIHLLQYAVDGSCDSPEFLLVLNKLLCGARTAMPIARRITLEERETRAVDGMLQAIVHNWKIIGRTSVRGLQESFLQRAGRLRLKGEDWHLKVEQKGIDVLLDQLPWGISVVKYPWMPRMMFVEWR